MAAEKRFEWIMKIILSRDGDGPFGIVEDYGVEKEYQKRGTVHWHMLLWCKPGTIPEDCIMAELPRSSNTKDPRLLTCVKLCIKCNAIVAVYQRDV